MIDTAGESGVRDALPPDPSLVVTALGAALARVHLDADGSRPPVRLPEFTSSEALAQVAEAIGRGWRAPPGTPLAHVDPDRLVQLLQQGEPRIGGRFGPPVPTVGDATIGNLVLPAPDDPSASLSASSNLTFRRSARKVELPRFTSWARAAIADVHRDLAVAAADVVAAFGPGAVLGFMDAYASERPSIEPLDAVRLDWWSQVTLVIGPGSVPVDGPAAS